MDKEKAGQSIQDDDCIIVDLSSDEEEFEPAVARVSKQKRNMGYMVIELDSDDEYLPEENQAKPSKVHSEDEIVEISDTDEPEIPIIIIDDDDDDSNFKAPVIIEDDSSNEGQNFSIEKEMELSQCNSSDNTGENLCQLLNDPKAKPDISDKVIAADGKIVPVVEQSRKRKCKTKNTCVPPGKTAKPAVGGKMQIEPLKKKFRAVIPEQGETRVSDCNTLGCFLRDIEKLKQYFGSNFKRNKDELVQKLFTLMNRIVFGNKLLEQLDICWNEKMQRTAGLCSSGQFCDSHERYTKIEISLKVCDSTDRIRDTLVHELCHVAFWLINGICNSHGDIWKYYAGKYNIVHPELPLVTRCHNYKIYYKCSQCKARTGCYTRWMDTERFICALCKGTRVLQPLTWKDGTPPENCM